MFKRGKVLKRIKKKKMSNKLNIIPNRINQINLIFAPTAKKEIIVSELFK